MNPLQVRHDRIPAKRLAQDFRRGDAHLIQSGRGLAFALG
jgi:hypothetical protein